MKVKFSIKFCNTIIKSEEIESLTCIQLNTWMVNFVAVKLTPAHHWTYSPGVFSAAQCNKGVLYLEKLMSLSGNPCPKYCVFKYRFCPGAIFIYRPSKYAVKPPIHIIKPRCPAKHIYNGEKSTDKSRFE